MPIALPRGLRTVALIALIAGIWGTTSAFAQVPVAQGVLGIQFRQIEEGVYVRMVLPGTGAAATDLFEGDIIVAANGENLVGIDKVQAVSMLKGPVGTEVRLTVERFPEGQVTEEVVVVRGAPTSWDRPKPKGFLTPVEREVNVLVSGSQAGRVPDFAKAIATWEAADDPGAVDRALLRLLRQVDAEGWSPTERLTAEERRAFWAAVGEDAALRAFLVVREPEIRLEIARFLVAHAGSARLASELVDDLPKREHPVLRKGLDALSRAVVAGELAAVDAAQVPTPDVYVAGAWQGSFGPRLADRAALELALDAEASRGEAPPTGLSTTLTTRLEHSGMALPWEFSHGEEPLGTLVAPPAPALVVERLEEGELDLAAHEGPIVVNFWASWCGPCRQELPKLQELEAELAETGLAIWAISTDDEPAKVKPAAKKLGLTLPVGYAPRDVRSAWGVSSLPRTFVLDAEHRILLDHTGYSDVGFPDFAKEIAAVAQGKRAPEVQLGEVRFGADAVTSLAAGPLFGKVRVLTTDASGRLWVGFSNRLVPVSRDEARLVLLEDEAVPLPRKPDFARWVDLDGDGTEELVTAAREGTLVRASRADGSPLWTDRHLDGIADLGVARAADGSPRVVVLRVTLEEMEDPLGPLANGNARPPVTRQVPRIEFLAADGAEREVVTLPAQVVQLDTHPEREAALVLLSDAEVYAVGVDGSLIRQDRGLQRVRQVRWGRSPGDDGALSPLFTSNAARSAYSGRFGEDGAIGVVTMTSGGDFTGLSATGEPTFRLDLQRRPTALVADVDGDGRDELLVYAYWFGLAALRIE